MAMEDIKNDSDQLTRLFTVGDERIEDLIEALDDPDRDISLRAQVVIRYLGNAAGMQALVNWYGNRKNQYPIAGPVPLPLTEWDYKFIDTNLVNKRKQNWREIELRYLYALAIDESERSKELMDVLLKSLSDTDESTSAGYAIQRVKESKPADILAGETELATLVQKKAFFIAPADRKLATARVLALNGTKDKVLVEVHVDGGRLAGEWYHVVLVRFNQGWKFLSITQVAVS